MHVKNVSVCIQNISLAGKEYQHERIYINNILVQLKIRRRC